MADSDLPGANAVSAVERTLLPPGGTWRAAHPESAPSAFEDLDFDAVADLRLAVGEVCTRLIRSRPCRVPPA